MIGTGRGSEIRQPLGYSITGGMFLPQWLTLYTTSLVYLYLDRFRGWVSGFATRSTTDRKSERTA
jgi:HAE1 family hydrophobic/amphiphilic exporter-1